MINFRKGEIATILTFTTLAVIGISTFVSSMFLKNKQTTKSSAEDRSQRYCNLNQTDPQCQNTCTKCDGNVCTYHPELEPWCKDTGCTSNSQCGGINPTPVPAGYSACPGKEDITGACNPACCDPNWQVP